MRGRARWPTSASDTCSSETSARALRSPRRHLGQPRLADRDQVVKATNLIDLMTTQFNFSGYPVVQGENFTMNLSAGSADMFIQADSFDAADIVSSQPQGSHSSDVMFVNYGTNLSALAVAAYTKLDSRQNPAEMTAVPL